MKIKYVLSNKSNTCLVFLLAVKGNLNDCNPDNTLVMSSYGYTESPLPGNYPTLKNHNRLGHDTKQGRMASSYIQEGFVRFGENSFWVLKDTECGLERWFRD